MLNPHDLPSLLKTIQTSPNVPTKQLALRLAQENFGTQSETRSATPSMGSQALRLYEAIRHNQHVTPASADTVWPSGPASKPEVLARFSAANDNWTKSAIIAAASEMPADYIVAALGNKETDPSTPFTSPLLPFVAALLPTVPPASAPQLLAAAANGGPLALTVLRGLATLNGDLPALDATSTATLKRLLESPTTAAATLQLAAKWDKAGTLTATTTAVIAQMFTDLGAPATADGRRAELASSLLSLKAQRAEALAKISALLADPAASDALKAQLTLALGDTPGADTAAALVTTFAQSKSSAAFDALLRRPEPALALLSAIRVGRVSAADLTPGQLDRLRTHPDRTVSRQATSLLDSKAPRAAQKADIIAKLTPEVEKPGDIVKGKALFTAACAVCHKIGDFGTKEVGPPLTGIGTHPAAELIVHIVDPNREVDPSFWQWNVTTKKGDTLAGIIAGENSVSLIVRNQGGDTEVKIDDIAKRENTQRSLMPEGFEGLGAEGLRDVIAFLRASAVAVAAPVTVAAPADPTPKAGGKGDAPLPPTTPITWESGKTKVLVIGGGSSHNFGKFFGGTDVATLRAAGYNVNYTEDRDQAAAELAHADVAVISVNRQFFDSPEYRKALFAFAAAGKGIVMHHPGTWYGFAKWPELNAQIVGGGARGHDKLGAYSVNALKPDHPIMKGVPATFEVFDELYYINAEPDKIPAGTSSIEVLAQTSPSIKYKQPHPVVWVTSHPTARIVGLTLGHDERVHDLPAFQTLLTNAVKWVSQKH